MSDEGKFVLKRRYSLEDIEQGVIKEIPESDLAFQTDKFVVQYEYQDEEEDKGKTTIRPGVYTLEQTSFGIKPKKIELKTHNLLETATNTRLIEKEAQVFFSKLDVYKKYKKDARRAILLYSAPGMGKSSTIAKISKDFIAEDPGTVVIFWDTSDLRPSAVGKFFSTGSKFSKKCTRMIFIMEDIGGGNAEGYHGPKTADSGLLELLDGAGVSFRKPTFIIATTNTPESLLKSLADRPGRFDQMFELEGPNADERIALATHIAGREITEQEANALAGKDAEGLSIAHISEIVIRSELHDKSFSKVIKEMKDHKKKIEAAFAKAQSKMGLMG
jgi:ATP-dependent 26S proteasome regulatory subunit